jgi:hypothetical protein
MKSPLLLAVILTLVTFCSAEPKIHFKHWYRQYREIFSDLMKTQECIDAYQIYLTGKAPADDKGKTTEPVVNCIFSQISEAKKLNMASASIVLGLLPATLALLGSTTAEVGLLATRRPVLAFLLASSAPAVNPTRPFDGGDPRHILETRQKTKSVRQLGKSTACIVSLVQYLIALGTIANLIHTSWELCINTLCSFAPEIAFLPALWAFLALPVHIFGTWAVLLRTRFVPLQPSLSTVSIRERIIDRIKTAVLPSIEHPHAEIKLKEETYFCVFISWFVACGTILHIIFGTLVFSSIIFISTQDAVYVVSRYLSSTIVARALVMYELAGMRQVVDVQEDVGYLVHFSGLSKS